MSTKNYAYKFVCLLICFGGCSWQLQLICNQYFKYDVITQISILTPDTLEPPSLTTCFPLESVLPKTNNDFIGSYNSNDNLNEPICVYNNKTPSINEITDMVKIGVTWEELPNKTSYEQPYDRMKISKSFHNPRVCYTFDVNETFPGNWSNSITGEEFYKIDFMANFNTTQLPYTVYIHSIDRTIGSHDTPFIQNLLVLAKSPFSSPPPPGALGQRGTIGGKVEDYTKLTYDKYRSELLTPPYVSDCEHYDQTHGHCNSKLRCIEMCVIDGFIEKLGKLPNLSLIGNVTSELALIGEFDPSNDSLQSTIDHIQWTCAAKYQKQDCVQDKYHLYHGQKSVFTVIQSDAIKIALAPSPKPEIHSIYKPSLLLIDFVVYILSTVGFWLGVAPLSILFEINLFAETKKRHKLSPSPTFQCRCMRQISAITRDIEQLKATHIQKG